MLGAIVMIIAGQYLGFYNPKLAVYAVDWNVVFLLACMMAIISVMIPTGGFEVMTSTPARISKDWQFTLLVLLGSASQGYRCCLSGGCLAL
jgi:Na+/H+ antiporter NhaD/arsenite permease-like protein